MTKLWTAVVPADLPPALRWLAAGQAVDSLGSGLVFPLTTLYVVRVLDRDLTWAGVVLFLHSLAGTLGVGLGGRLADRIGRKPLLLASLITSGLLSWSIGLWPAASVYAAAMVAFGLTTSLFRPASQALVSDLVPGRERQVFSLIYMANNLGVAAGAALGGTLAAWSYRAVFWADALTFWLFAAVVARTVPDPFGERLRARRRGRPILGTNRPAAAAATRPAGGAGRPEPAGAAGSSGHPHQGDAGAGNGTAAGAGSGTTDGPRAGATARSASPGATRGWRRRWHRWYEEGLVTVVLLAVASLGLFFAYAQLHTALPVDMTRRGFSEASYGLLWTLNATLVVILTPVASAWADRWGWSLATLLRASAVTHAAGFGLLAAAGLRPGYAAFVLAMAVITVGEVLHAMSFSAAVARVAPEDRRGTYQGVAGMLTGVAWMAGPLLGGVIADGYGIGTLWVVTVVACLGALAVFRAAEAVEHTRRHGPGIG